ncbi:hypothetical protein KIPB_007934 [Kipferlia bialata]|uniref:Uncharacterized protein n=1 Tax=Kipferlia bialata TaxID=797122 RepID=A0A9K3CZA4_9EUKA|nr:hypothetical protein KIPB_007934 [Kipferlia bialata]|eukprot:g7934.t1
MFRACSGTSESVSVPGSVLLSVSLGSPTLNTPEGYIPLSHVVQIHISLCERCLCGERYPGREVELLRI